VGYDVPEQEGENMRTSSLVYQISCHGCCVAIEPTETGVISVDGLFYHRECIIGEPIPAEIVTTILVISSLSQIGGLDSLHAKFVAAWNEFRDSAKKFSMQCYSCRDQPTIDRAAILARETYDAAIGVAEACLRYGEGYPRYTAFFDYAIEAMRRLSCESKTHLGISLGDHAEELARRTPTRVRGGARSDRHLVLA